MHTHSHTMRARKSDKTRVRKYIMHKTWILVSASVGEQQKKVGEMSKRGTETISSGTLCTTWRHTKFDWRMNCLSWFLVRYLCLCDHFQIYRRCDACNEFGLRSQFQWEHMQLDKERSAPKTTTIHLISLKFKLFDLLRLFATSIRSIFGSHTLTCPALSWWR